jgi:hypothetical protein
MPRRRGAFAGQASAASCSAPRLADYADVLGLVGGCAELLRVLLDGLLASLLRRLAALLGLGTPEDRARAPEALRIEDVFLEPAVEPTLAVDVRQEPALRMSKLGARFRIADTKIIPKLAFVGETRARAAVSRGTNRGFSAVASRA